MALHVRLNKAYNKLLHAPWLCLLIALCARLRRINSMTLHVVATAIAHCAPRVSVVQCLLIACLAWAVVRPILVYVSAVFSNCASFSNVFFVICAVILLVCRKELFVARHDSHQSRCPGERFVFSKGLSAAVACLSRTGAAVSVLRWRRYLSLSRELAGLICAQQHNSIEHMHPLC